MGHVHKLQEYHISNIHGDDWVGLSPGWLGSQREAAEYIKGVSDWSLGFAVTYHKKNGQFFHQLIQIKKMNHRYECFYGGEIFGG
jgi:hypothetical protein